MLSVNKIQFNGMLNKEGFPISLRIRRGFVWRMAAGHRLRAPYRRLNPLQALALREARTS